MGALNSLVAAVWPYLPSFQARKTDVSVRPEARIIYVPRSEAGVRVSVDEALRVSAFWACISVISRAIAASTWEVFEEDANGNRTLRRDARAWRLLNVSPNPEMTAYAFKQTGVINRYIWGNFFAEIERSPRGDPMALWPLPTERCWLDRTESGALVLRVQNYARADTILPYRDVLHWHGMSIDGIEGLSTIAYAARSLGHAAALDIFGASFFGNGTQVGGVLMSKKPYTQEQLQDVQHHINVGHRGVHNAHQFLVLGDDFELKPFTSTPEDSQFVETKQAAIEDVARWFGVPPHKIGHLLRATFNNIEEQGLEFVRDTLTPEIEPMAQEADLKLLPFGNRRLLTRIDVDWLGEGNATAKAEADAKDTQNGLATINEIRRKRGRNTIGPEGDVLRIQDQMKPVMLPSDEQRLEQERREAAMPQEENDADRTP